MQLLLHLRQVTLIYHKKLDDDWQAAAEKLRTVLAETPSSSESAVSVIGRSHKQVLANCLRLWCGVRVIVECRPLNHSDVRLPWVSLLRTQYRVGPCLLMLVAGSGLCRCCMLAQGVPGLWQTADEAAFVSQKLELDRDYVVENFEVGGQTYSQKQVRRTGLHAAQSPQRRRV